MKIDVYHHFPPSDTTASGKLDQIIDLLTALGAQMSDLAVAVADVRQRVTAKNEQQDAMIADLTQQLADANAATLAAMANDAAQDAEIADKQAEIDAATQANAEKQAALDEANADANRAIADLATIDPTETPTPDEG